MTMELAAWVRLLSRCAPIPPKSEGNGSARLGVSRRKQIDDCYASAWRLGIERCVSPFSLASQDSDDALVVSRKVRPPQRGNNIFVAQCAKLNGVPPQS